MTFSDISKEVGWEYHPEPYPTRLQVDTAWHKKDLKQFLTWYRFLPSPYDDNTRLVMNLVCDYYNQLNKQ